MGTFRNYLLDMIARSLSHMGTGTSSAATLDRPAQKYSTSWGSKRRRSGLKWTAVASRHTFQRQTTSLEAAMQPPPKTDWREEQLREEEEDDEAFLKLTSDEVRR